MLAGGVAIITKGARGIGRSIALKFAKEGCSVVTADLLISEAKKTETDVIAKGGKGLAIHCNVSESSQGKHLVDMVIQKFGKMDILVNNAVLGSPIHSFADIKEYE